MLSPYYVHQSFAHLVHCAKCAKMCNEQTVLRLQYTDQTQLNKCYINVKIPHDFHVDI